MKGKIDVFTQKPVLRSERVIVKKLCTVPLCGNPLSAKGFCKGHYNAFKYRGETMETMSIRQKEKTQQFDICSVPNCLRKAIKNRLCKQHQNI